VICFFQIINDDNDSAASGVGPGFGMLLWDSLALSSVTEISTSSVDVGNPINEVSIINISLCHNTLI